MPQPREKFGGAGVYLIYYNGGHPAYSTLAKRNKSKWNWPIYVGQALPSGVRKGAGGLDTEHGEVLYQRLRDHAKSIELAENLKLQDFRYRWLCVDEVFISLGETLLITKYQPVWNVVVDGFGNHAVGKGRKDMARPAWDILHPGRKWAAALRADIAEEFVIGRISAHFKDDLDKSSYSR